MKICRPSSYVPLLVILTFLFILLLSYTRVQHGVHLVNWPLVTANFTGGAGDGIRQSVTQVPGKERLTIPSSATNVSATTNRLVHQTWKVKTLPHRFATWSKSWSTCFPGWERKLWTDDDNQQFIAKHYAWFLPTYKKYSNIYKADAVRYFYMYHYGGIYADLDAECLRPFEHLIKNHSIVFGAMEGKYTGHDPPEGYVQNSLMYSRARHPFWMQVIKKMMKKTGSQPEAVTGPFMLMEAIEEYRKNNPKNTDIFIYPGSYFNPFSWIVRKDHICKDLNNMDDAKLKQCREQYVKNSYVLQYHTQVWGRGHVLRRRLLGW